MSDNPTTAGKIDLNNLDEAIKRLEEKNANLDNYTAPPLYPAVRYYTWAFDFELLKLLKARQNA